VAAPDHNRWQTLLDRYLVAAADGINRFRYQAVSNEDRTHLDDYLAALAALDPRGLERKDQMAYWINLYNAQTVRVVLNHPRKGSILRMGAGFFAVGPWDETLTEVAGQPLTLNDIEHRILRPIFEDHRIHFAVNCASIGCPNLSASAYRGTTLDAQLAEAETAYLNHPRGVSFDERGRLTISTIFKWYRGDFADSDEALLAYLAAHHRRLGAELSAYEGRIRYRYDWSLNRPDS
jgi:hypothetical protein